MLVKCGCVDVYVYIITNTTFLIHFPQEPISNTCFKGIMETRNIKYEFDPHWAPISLLCCIDKWYIFLFSQVFHEFYSVVVSNRNIVRC